MSLLALLCLIACAAVTRGWLAAALVLVAFILGAEAGEKHGKFKAKALKEPQ